MKKISTILLFSANMVCYSQLSSIVVRNDTTFSVNPSTGVWTQLTNLVPAPTGQSGKYLSTNGSVYTWSMPTSSATWGSITGTLSTQTDLQSSLDLKANLASPTFTGTVSGITASMVGLGNVTNESKATMFTSPTFTGTVSGVTATMFGLGNVTNESKATMFTSPTFTGTVALGTSPTMTTPNITTGFKIGGAAAVNNTIAGDGTNYVALTTRANYSSFVVSGSNATTTGQSLVDITGLVSGTLTNGTTYEVEAMLFVTTSAVTTGTQYGIGAGGTGGAAVVEVLVVGTTTTNAVASVTESAAGTAQGTFLTTSGSSGIIWIKGIVTTRGSGTANISIQHLKVTSGTSTVNIGSWMKIRQLN